MSSALHSAIAILQRTPVGSPDTLAALIHEPNIPDACFDLALCDWASHLLHQEKLAKRPPEEACWEAVASKQQWLAGLCSHESLIEASDRVKESLDLAVWEIGFRQRLIGLTRGLFASGHLDDNVVMLDEVFRRITEIRARSVYAAYMASWFQTRISQYSAGRNSFFMILCDHIQPEYAPFRVHQPEHLAFLRERLLFWTQQTHMQQVRLMKLLWWRQEHIQQRTQVCFEMWEDVEFS